MISFIFVFPHLYYLYLGRPWVNQDFWFSNSERADLSNFAMFPDLWFFHWWIGLVLSFWNIESQFAKSTLKNMIIGSIIISQSFRNHWREGFDTSIETFNDLQRGHTWKEDPKPSSRIRGWSKMELHDWQIISSSLRIVGEIFARRLKNHSLVIQLFNEFINRPNGNPWIFVYYELDYFVLTERMELTFWRFVTK